MQIFKLIETKMQIPQAYLIFYANVAVLTEKNHFKIRAPTKFTCRPIEAFSPFLTFHIYSSRQTLNFLSRQIRESQGRRL